jgi:ribosomal protein S12 methylthiotransferase accessory factor
MRAAALRSTFINARSEVLAYRIDEETHAGVAELLALYNPLGGPVRKLVTYFAAVGGLPVHVGHTEYYDIDYVLQRVTGASSLDTGMQDSLFAGGKGFGLNDMFVSSLGETVERLLGALYYYSAGTEHRYGTYRDLTRQGVRCLAPEELPLFAPEQYADPDFLFEPFTETSLLGWVTGTRLFSGEEVAVPAQLVELVYPRRPDEAVIGHSSSGGLSSHTSRTRALFHGITELIERDAINLRWYTGAPLTRITIDRPPATPALRRLLESTESLPGDITLYSHSVDIPEVPVVTAIEIDPWLNRYAYHSGGGADIDIDTAALKALTEFGQIERAIRHSLLAPERAFAQSVAALFDMAPDDPVAKIDLFHKVVSYYGYRQNVEKLDWYLNGGEEVPLSALPRSQETTVEGKFNALCAVLRRHGLDPIVFDFTPVGMRHVRLIKVFIAELTQPFLQSLPVFGHPRFATTAQAMGRCDHPMTYDELVRDPLPFP